MVVVTVHLFELTSQFFLLQRHELALPESLGSNLCVVDCSLKKRHRMQEKKKEQLCKVEKIKGKDGKSLSRCQVKSRV